MKKRNWLAVLIAIIVIIGMSGCLEEFDNLNSEDTYRAECIEDASSPSGGVYPSIEIPATPKSEKQLIDIKAEPGYGDKPEDFYVRESKKPFGNEDEIEYCVLFVENTQKHLALSWKLYDKNGKLTDWKGNFITHVEVWEFPYAPDAFKDGLLWNPIHIRPDGVDYPNGKVWIKYEAMGHLNQAKHEGDVLSRITLRDSGKVLYCRCRFVNLGDGKANTQSQTTTPTGKTSQTTGFTAESQLRPSHEGLEILDEKDDKEKNTDTSFEQKKSGDSGDRKSGESEYDDKPVIDLLDTEAWHD